MFDLSENWHTTSVYSIMLLSICEFFNYQRGMTVFPYGRN